MFGWREVYMTSSIMDCTKARDALDQNGILYQYKIKSATGDINGRLGAAITEYAFQYYLYVKKQDFEQAQYLVGNAPIR